MQNSEIEVILVDEYDNGIGLLDKQEAHIRGVLHRAVSVFIFNDKKEMLLQRRANSKYHSAGLWSNACCSHPLPEESSIKCAERRLKEEMGFTCVLNKSFDFIYHSTFDNGLIEHEFDHVFIGHYSDEIRMNPAEVCDWKYVHCDQLRIDIKNNPEQYSAWFKIALPKVLEKHFDKEVIS